MLAASGLWQVAEYGTLAYRHGAARTAEFFKQFPGVAGYLRKVGRDPDHQYDEPLWLVWTLPAMSACAPGCASTGRT